MDIETIAAALQLLIVAFFATVPLFHFRRVDEKHSRFYLRMADSPTARLAYRVALAFLIMTVNILSGIIDGPYV